MSQPPDDAVLHRLHDGELDPAERARTEAALDAIGQQKLAALDQLGGALRAAYGGAGADFDVWPAVERAIARTKVVPLRRRLGRAPIFISTLAVAAAVLAMLLLPGGSHPSNDCVIDELEVSGATATIMQVSDDTHGGTTTVLWLEE